MEDLVGREEEFPAESWGVRSGDKKVFWRKTESLPVLPRRRIGARAALGVDAAQGQQDSFKQLAVFGMQEAIVADFDKAVQDMLEKAGEKNSGR